MESKLITLITDFGHKDPFVGIMKGVIFGINPKANIIDLSHGIPAQDVLAAALVLRYGAPSFPSGTIHVVVVDPGVGSGRRPLLIESEDRFFIGPDNGILSMALEGKTISRIIDLSNNIYHLQPTSATFHGRDIFAPVAGYLSLGVSPGDFGKAVEDFKRLAWPSAVKGKGTMEGRVIYIDGFGNLVTNLRAGDLSEFQRQELTISVASITIHGLAPNYGSVAERDYTALINSWGLLEISAFKGSAQLLLGVKIGEAVTIREAGPGEKAS